jgi:hypothetical protein
MERNTLKKKHSHTNTNSNFNTYSTHTQHEVHSINFHHSKAATATLCQQLADRKVDIALIQTLWLYKGQIRGLTNTGGTVYSVAPGDKARSCIYQE